MTAKKPVESKGPSRFDPDWRDPSAYPDPENTSLHRWAWEFLRRNSAFDSEYKAARIEQSKMVADKTLPLGWRERPLGKVVMKYGVSLPTPAGIAPKGTDAPFRFDQGQRWLGHYKVNGNRIVAAADRDDRIALEFDLDAPIEPQLDRARKLLLANQKKLPRRRNQLAKMGYYLRTLDAIEAGADIATMLEVFKDENDEVDRRHIRAWRLRAEELRDGGYRRLVSS